MPPLSASALAELRALVAEANKDAGVLNAPELRELRDLMVKLGAKLPAPAAPAALSVNDDLLDEECVKPDVPEQEFGPASAGEPSEEARASRGCILTAWLTQLGAGHRGGLQRQERRGRGVLERRLRRGRR